MAQDERMLLPCPFCGGAPTVRQAMGETWVVCGSCSATTNSKSRETVAFDLWNRRAAPAQPAAVEGAGEPVAWARRWFVDGITPKKERNENGRMAWPKKFTLHEVTPSKIMTDDVALYAHPSTPADDALRVAVEALEKIEDLPAAGTPEHIAAAIASEALAEIAALKAGGVK